MYNPLQIGDIIRCIVKFDNRLTFDALYEVSKSFCYNEAQVNLRGHCATEQFSAYIFDLVHRPEWEKHHNANTTIQEDDMCVKRPVLLPKPSWIYGGHQLPAEGDSIVWYEEDDRCYYFVERVTDPDMFRNRYWMRRDVFESRFNNKLLP